MPIKIYWLLENRVSYFKYIGDITLEELAEASEMGIRMLEESTNTLLVHTIQDGEAMGSFPRNLAQVNEITKQSHAHERMGWMVSSNTLDPITRFVAETVGKLSKTRQRFTDTVEEALTFLNYVDSTLPELSEVDLSQLRLVRSIGETHGE